MAVGVPRDAAVAISCASDHRSHRGSPADALLWKAFSDVIPQSAWGLNLTGIETGVDLSASTCHELIEAANQAASVEELHTLCSFICERAGFDYFLYGAVLAVSMVRPQTFIISGYPSEWWQRYQERNYIRVDPVLQHTTERNTVPLDWHDVDPAAYAHGDQVRTFMSEAEDFGLASGVSFPVHGREGEYAILSLATRDDHGHARARIIESMPYVQLLAGYVHEAARRIFEQGNDVTVARPQLTDREKECLLWAAEGKTSWDTARILAISERTVLFHLHNAAHKLDVSNRAHAVARAVSQGYITPQFR